LDDSQRFEAGEDPGKCIDRLDVKVDLDSSTCQGDYVVVLVRRIDAFSRVVERCSFPIDQFLISFAFPSRHIDSRVISDRERVLV
jgi:hypothetical protein